MSARRARAETELLSAASDVAPRATIHPNRDTLIQRRMREPFYRTKVASFKDLLDGRNLLRGNGRGLISPGTANVRQHGSDLRIGELPTPGRHRTVVCLAVDGYGTAQSLCDCRDRLLRIARHVFISRQRRERAREALTVRLMAAGAF